MEYANSKSDPAIHLAGFWAAKEAAFKAVSHLFSPKYNQICVHHYSNGKPFLTINSNSSFQIERIDVSISHIKSHAIATVIVDWRSL